jgi:hypothetical protein
MRRDSLTSLLDGNTEKERLEECGVEREEEK